MRTQTTRPRRARAAVQSGRAPRTTDPDRAAGPTGASVPAGLAFPVQRATLVGSSSDREEIEAERVARSVVTALRSPGASPMPEEHEHGPGCSHGAVRRMADVGAIGLAGGQLDDDTERVLRSPVGGRSIEPSLRGRLEGSLGADLSAVRLHAGPQAADLNRGMSAMAFTHGRDIYFRDGMPDTGTSSGMHLLAHELTHTIQQGTATPLRRQEDDGSPTEPGTGSGVPRVQRAVGFEFEDAYWRPWQVDLTAANKKSEGGISVAPVPRKGVIWAGSKWELQGDDTPGPKASNIEYVTDPFDESEVGLAELKKALQEIKAVATQLGPHAATKPGPGDDDALKGTDGPPYLLDATSAKSDFKAADKDRKKELKKREKKEKKDKKDKSKQAVSTLGVEEKAPDTVADELPAPSSALEFLDRQLFVQPHQHKLGSTSYPSARLRMSRGDKGIPSFRVKMQASLGTTLTALPQIMQDLGTAGGKEKPSEIRSALTGPAYKDDKTHRIPHVAPTIARAAQASLAKSVDLRGHGESPELHGFLSAVVAAVLALQRNVPAEPKTFFLLMPRTSFAVMFASLKEAGEPLVGQGKAVAAAVIEAINGSGFLEGDLGTFKQALADDLPLIGRNMAAWPLTIGAWVRGFCDEGKDYLIASQLEEFLTSKDRKDVASKSTITSAKGHQESFGSVEKGDVRPDTKEFLAVFEHRAIDFGSAKTGNAPMDFDEAASTALTMLHYATYIRDEDTKRKKGATKAVKVHK